MANCQKVNQMNMRILVISVLAITLLGACSGERQKAQKEIRVLEAQMEENASPLVANALIRKYLLYNAQYPQDRETNSRYLYRAASTQLRIELIEASVNTLVEALLQYADTENTLNNASLLAAVYREKLQDTISSTTLYQVLSRRYPEEVSIKEKLDALEPAPASLEDRLEEMRQAVFSDSTGSINYRIANYFIHSCELLAFLQPEVPATPEWLNKAAEIARATKKNAKALELYERIYQRYPAYEKAPQALFLKGFILDEEMKQIEEARESYQLFLERYPDHDFADDAQFLLDNLDKSETDIIDHFQQKATE